MSSQATYTVLPARRFPLVLLVALLAVLIVAALLATFFIGSGRNDMREQTALAIEHSVSSRARLCYAMEGAYPSDLAYLEDHYGLAIDHDHYIVSYETIGANVAPDIRVLER